MDKKILYIGNKLAEIGKTPTHIDTLTPLLEAEGHTVRTTSSYAGKVRRLADMLTAVVKNRKWCEVVLIDTYSTANYWYAISAAMLCRRYDIPYIPILHGGDLPKRIVSSKKTLDTFINGAFRVICPSGYLLEQFEKAGYQKLQIINNTIELDKYTFTHRDKIHPRLLWVRSFAEIYNPTMAVKVAQKLNGKYDQVELCMVGPDKDGSLQTTIQLANESNVNLTTTGKLPKADWHKLSENYDVFINTTHFDNLPVSLIEAMALGLPVVSTDVGGIPHLIDDNKTGLLVPDGDVQAMAAAVDNLISDHEYAGNIIHAARKKVQEYSWEVVKHEWNSLLGSI